jgi:hypothetical protein
MNRRRLSNYLITRFPDYPIELPRLRSGFRQRAQTPAKRLKLLWYIDLPSALHHSVRVMGTETENRRHERIKLDVRAVWIDGNASTVRGAIGRTCDISISGVSVVLPTKIAPGHHSQLEFALPGVKQPLRVSVVMRGHEGFRYGFEFTTLSQVQREAIQRYCDRMAVLGSAPPTTTLAIAGAF